MRRGTEAARMKPGEGDDVVIAWLWELIVGRENPLPRVGERREAPLTHQPQQFALGNGGPQPRRHRPRKVRSFLKEIDSDLNLMQAQWRRRRIWD